MKRLLSLITLVCLLSLTVFGLTACDGPKVPEKLSAPVIVLEEDVATWEENSNADKFEISLNGELSYVENNYTSKKLNDGQSLKVRAIGDGINFTTSDWSNVVTYTAPKNPHTCDFSGEWKNDETHHWHECTCGEIDTKVEHSGGTATETEKAKCEVCGASYGELLTPPAHECDFNGEWKYDDTHHWHECTCGEIDTKVEHSGGTATETEKAKCEVCGAAYGELKAPDHKHEATGEWKSDATHHWKECTCGAPGEKTSHNFDQAIIEEKFLATIADCDDDATYYYSCVCGVKGTQTFTALDSKLGHDWKETWTYDETDHWHECERANCNAIDLKVEHSGGTATETTKAVCSECNQEYGELLTPPTHECDFSGEWKYDETHHWHECTCGETDTKVEHSGGTATETTKAVCSECNQEYGELLTPPTHECDFSGEWKYDETHHWHECTCGETDTKVEHSGGTATETTKAVCSECNQEYGELLEDNPVTSTAPTYISIMASNSEPRAEEVSDHIKLMSVNRSVSISDVLIAYFENSDNSLGEETPLESKYDVYSYIGQTIYVQIWLNNPDQNTILSLKLNGTKYQAGGALQSFFVEYEDTYLNCVYVAIEIPADTYFETSFEVTEIEYVEGSNISQEGKSVLIDEENDTVIIGLPYEEKAPTISRGDIITTASSISLTINVLDEDDYMSVSGGWLRAVIYDYDYNIISQQKLVSGDNEVTFEGLSAESWYLISTVLYVDGRTGYGLYPNIMHTTYSSTDSALTVSVSSDILLNETTGKYYPAIDVQAELADSFTFTKIELYCQNEEEAMFTSDFDGSIQITENLLSGIDYRVKIYYKNASGLEQDYEYYTYTDTMYSPSVWHNTDLSVGLINDSILAFEFSNDKCNMENLKVQIWFTKSSQYIAEDVLYLLDNPNAIEDLRAELDTLDPRDLAWRDLSNRIDELENTLEYASEYYSEFTRDDWDKEALKGKYAYEFIYGADEEFFKGKDNMYYVVLKDYQSKRITDDSWQFSVSADIDYNNGEDLEHRDLCSGWFTIDPAIGEDDFLFVASDDDYNELFTLDENNVLYLELMSRTGYGYESTNAIGYVNQIVLTKDYDEIVKVLWSQEEPEHDVDEEAWLENLINALINGEDPSSVFPYGQLEAISFDLDDVDLSDISSGEYTIRYTYKMYGKTYDEENQFDIDGYIDYKVVGSLPQASINIKTNTEEFGMFEIIVPETLNYGNWYYYSLELRDENLELIGTYNQDNVGEIGKLKENYSIRVKLTADPYNDMYVDGEWSEWYTCSRAKLTSPSGFNQSYQSTGVNVEWAWVEGTLKYVYKINNGEEQETTECYVSELKDGDTIIVKAVPDENSMNLESDYSIEYTIEDNRTPLAKPVLSLENNYLVWNAVENADSYVVFNVTTNSVYRTVSGTSIRIINGNVYVVKALPYDYENYCASESDSIDTTLVVSNPIISITDEGLVSFSEYYDLKAEVIYTYIINDGEEQTTTNPYDVVTLEKGSTIKVKVSCEGYKDSEWVSATYEASNTEQEPEHIETTIADLVASKPQEDKTVIYELSAIWILKSGGSTYGNGWLCDENGNEIEVYGLCSDSSVLTYSEGAYVYQNNKSYSQLELVTGSLIKVGMIYSIDYDNYMCYFIEQVDEAEDVTISEINENFDNYNSDYVRVTGIVYAGDKDGLYIKDNNDNTLFIKGAYSDISLGQVITASGKTKLYYTLPQFVSTTITKGEIQEYQLTLYNGTIDKIIEANSEQSEKVFKHNAYRTTGVLIQDGANYFLTYDVYKLQIKSSTYDNDFNNLITYVDKRISINILVVDRFTTTDTFRVVPLPGDDANIEEISGNKLPKPVVTVSNTGLASWEEIENAISYEYIINNGMPMVTDDLSVQLSEGDTIVVRAFGDGENYEDSDYSYAVSFLAVPKTIAEINQNFDNYTETPIQVSGVVYARDLYGLFIIDENQDTLYVKYNYSNLNIEIGQSITFKGTTNAYYTLPQLVATEAVVGSIVDYDLTLYVGTISQVLEAIDDQSSMVYNHDAFRVTGVLTLDGDSYFLIDGDYKLQIKSSICDDEYNMLTSYVNQKISVNVIISDYFTTTGIFRVLPLPGTDMNVEIIYEDYVSTPVLSISDTGLVSWNAVEHATSYLYKINNGANQSTTDLSVQLSLGDTIVVKAMGDGIYGSSEWSEAISYLAEEEEEELTIGQKIQAEYDALKAGTSTTHTTWSFEATVIDMTATVFNQNYNTYNVKLIASIDGVLIGVYNGQVDGGYPANIDGLSVGSVITITGTIAEKYTMTSGSYTVNIEFSMPEISWVTSDVEETTIDINFISINDTHGALTDSDEGNSIGRIDTLIDSLESKNGEYIFIHVGDAFQGSYVCGETYGLAMIEALNKSNLDCFVIGNHEFDWGIDKIAAYKDGNLENGEANFPFLGANIYYKGTTTRPEWIDAYTIIEQDGVKVGIIGIMGHEQESDILTRYVEEYDFVDPMNIVQTTAAYLRDTAACDVVVIATHDYDATINTKYAKLSGSSRIDAIFCAHTHQNIYDELSRTDSKTIPVVQCNHKNVNAAEVILTLDENNEYAYHYVEKHSISYTYNSEKYYYYDISSDVQTVIDSYQELIDESNEVIGTLNTSLTKQTLGTYAVDAMLNEVYSNYDFGDVDMAIMNTGGVRAEIEKGDITRAEVFEVFPFNNSVVLVNISGALLKDLYGNNSDYMYMDIDDSIGSYTSLEDETIYQLAVIDYVFENTRYYQFDGLKETDYIQTDYVLRDLLMTYLDTAY